MDKRTVAAFILIGLIIFLMPYYFRLVGGSAPKPTEPEMNPRVTPPAAAADTASPFRDALRQSVVSLEQDTTSSASFEPTDVTVETDHFTARFSTRGGRLVSLRLKHHADAAGDPLELVGPGGSGLALSLSGRSLEDVEFCADRAELVLSGTQQGELVFRGGVDGKWLEKRLRFQGDRYRLELAISAEGLASGDRVGLGWQRSLAHTEAGGAFSAPAADMVVTMAGEEVEQWPESRLAEGDPVPSGRIDWVVIRNKYFASAMIPTGGLVYDLNLRAKPSPTGSNYDVEILAQYPGEPLTFGVFVGPLAYGVLRQQNTDLDGRETPVNLDELLQFGWAFFRPILHPTVITIIHAFSALHGIIPNYGLVIVVFSILVKVVLFPLTRKSMESMSRMQKIQPRITALKEKYGQDSQKLNQHMMKLYKEEKVNPVGGCLPMVLQAPILFSLFNVFSNAIELRQSHFALWIHDLSQPDVLHIAGFAVHVLPLVMAAAMFVQQKLTIKDPKQAAMVYIMPVFMVWIFWTMSSGLVLYFTMYNFLSVFEQQVLKRAPTVPA